MNEIKPTAIFTPFGGRVEIKMFGRQTGDWSLKPLDYEDKNKEILLNRIACITYPTIERVWAPRPSEFNARILEPIQMTNEAIGHYQGSEKTHTMHILWKGPAEGVEIMSTKTCSAFFFTADCAVIVLSDRETGRTVASHAGRDSVLDRSVILNGEKSRSHFSVVDSMLEYFEDKTRVRAFICSGLCMHEHPLNAEKIEHQIYNQNVLKYLQKKFPSSFFVSGYSLYISVINIIEEQLIGRGIKPDNIGTDCSDPVNDKNERCEFTWWSHSRWLVEGQKGHDGRNGILVTRRW